MAIRGSCHCGETRFTIAEAPASVTRSTCSFCSKRGALWAYCPRDQFRLETLEAQQSTYLWKTRLVSHHFCPVCGCTTFTETPDWSSGEANLDNPIIAVNARILDDFDLDRVPVETIDGKNLW